MPKLNNNLSAISGQVSPLASSCNYQKITYLDIYPYIDWVLYIKGGALEYDFVVKLGGKVSDINLQYNGHTAISKKVDGSLSITTPMGSVTEDARYSFQGDGQAVQTSFIVEKGCVRFKTGPYHGLLTIDPTLT